MVTIALAWLYMSAVCFTFGWASVGVLECSDRKATRAVPLSVLPLLGLAEIAVLTGYLSLVMPIGLTANAVVLAVAIGLLWIHRRRLDSLGETLSNARPVAPAYVVMQGLLFLLLVLKSAIVVDGTLTKVFHSDTAYYHAPSIRWIVEFGVVPGLGNLLSPLAVDYLWFQPAALFGFSFLLPERLHALMGFAVFWAFCFALGGLRELCRERFRCVPSNLFRTLMLLPLLELSNYIVSDSGDEPSAVFVLITLALGCRYVERESDPRANRPLFAAILILSLFSVALKWSVLPLLLLAAAFSLQRARLLGWRSLAGVMGLGMLMLTPKLIRSVMLSGYLVYPFPALDLFDVDWKMPADVVATEKAYVESMARIRFDRPGERLAGSFGDWFTAWVPQFFSAPVAVALLAAAALFLMLLTVRRRPVSTVVSRYRWVFLTVLLALAYWFITAPHIRFAYGFLSAAVLLLLMATAAGLGMFASTPGQGADRRAGDLADGSSGVYVTTATGFVLAFAILLSCPRPFPGDSLGTGVSFSDFYPSRIDRMRRGKVPSQALLFQDPYPEVRTRLFELGALLLYRPVTGQHCWHAPVPCTPYLYRRIEPRGSSLASGFRPIPGPVEAFDGNRLVEEWREQRAQQHHR